MFRKTRAQVEQAIDNASTDVHDLTKTAEQTANALMAYAAALFLASVAALLISAAALARTTQR